MSSHTRLSLSRAPVMHVRPGDGVRVMMRVRVRVRVRARVGAKVQVRVSG